MTAAALGALLVLTSAAPPPVDWLSRDCPGKALVVTALADGNYLWSGQYIGGRENLRPRFEKAAAGGHPQNFVIEVARTTRFGNLGDVVLAALMASYPCKWDFKELP